MFLDKTYRELATNYALFTFRHTLIDKLFLYVSGGVIASLERRPNFGVTDVILVNDTLNISIKNKLSILK